MIFGWRQLNIFFISGLLILTFLSDLKSQDTIVSIDFINDGVIDSAIDYDTVKVFTYKIKGRTASGIMTTKIEEPFVAISRDLLESHPLHSYIEIFDCEWAGRYKVMDIMGKNHVKVVDIFYSGKRKDSCTCVIKEAE